MPDTRGAAARWLPRIAKGSYLKVERAGGVLSLLHAEGQRPTADDIARLLDEAAEPPLPAARISHRPDGDEGWLELLASGLTFDISGLRPAAPVVPEPALHLFGLSGDVRDLALEGVLLAPGQHVASGAAMLPVVRVMNGLAARLASLPDVKAVCWHPARSWMEPGYFIRIVTGWLGGGAFPALGLTALARTADGLESSGLDFFTGQELQIAAREGEPPAATAKLAARVIDLLVRQGPLCEAIAIPGPDGEALLAEPGADGRIVKVRRGA